MSKAVDFMADQFQIWLNSEPEVPLHEYLNFSHQECDEWLTKQMSCEVAYELFMARNVPRA
jgi:hypothetical protein